MGSDRTAGELTAREAAIAAAVFLLLAFAFFAVNLDSGIIIDDGPLIHLASTVAKGDPASLLRPDIGIYWRPVGKLLFAADAAVWGADPVGFHLTNLLLHAACTLLVFFLARGIYERRAIAWAAGLVFAVHPIHHGAVNWISARYDLLCTLFVLAALIAVVRYARRRRPVDLAWIALFQLLAVFSKELAFTFPLLVAMVLLAMPEGTAGERLRSGAGAIAVSAVVLVAVLGLRLAVMGRIGGGANFLQRGPLEGIVYALASLLLYSYAPVYGLEAIGPRFARGFLIGGLLLAGLTVWCAASGESRRARVMPVFMALAACVPLAPFLRISRELDNAYMFYLPSALLAVGLAAAIFGSGKRPSVKGACALLIAVLFPLMLAMNNRVYARAAALTDSVREGVVNAVGADPPPTLVYLVGVPHRVGGFYIHFGDLTGYLARDYGMDRVHARAIESAASADPEPGRVVRVFVAERGPSPESIRLVERTGLVD